MGAGGQQQPPPGNDAVERLELPCIPSDDNFAADPEARLPD